VLLDLRAELPSPWVSEGSGLAAARSRSQAGTRFRSQGPSRRRCSLRPPGPPHQL